MKDKIFMTFLCATLCVVTNAMGALGDGPGKCKVQVKARPKDAERSYTGNVWLKDEFLFVSDNQALRCGGEDCGDGVEFNMKGYGYVYRCTVTGETGEWKQVTSGSGIDFCKDSKIKQFSVRNAEYPIVHMGQGDEKFDGHAYIIDTKGFCMNADCKKGYVRVVDGNNKYECKEQAGGEGDKATENGGGDNEIEQLGKWLDEETGKFERSKWRDAEGKFNTARLASDSIAGVVLGTAGGLISSKVIKKKQVENGFEDIKCTIGSQEVADWGDEFQVGIQ